MTDSRVINGCNWLFISLLLVASPLVSAKDYLGFNLCGKATTEEIDKFARKNGGYLYDAFEHGDKVAVTKAIVNDFSFGDEIYKVNIELYMGKIYLLEIPGDKKNLRKIRSLSELLTIKYGEPRRIDLSFPSVATYFLYNTKNDSSLELTYHERIDSAEIRYECKSMRRAIQAEEERFDKELKAEKKKSIRGMKL